MDFEKTKLKANNIEESAEELISYYKELISSLTKIYTFLAKTDTDSAKKIYSLLSRYNSMIKEVKNGYINSTNQILSYIDSSSQNLNELEDSIAFSAKELSSVLNSIESNDGIERLF